METSMAPNLWRMLRAADASFRKWRQRRKTLRVLAELDECQLRDIGLTRNKALPDDSFRLLRGYKTHSALAGRDGVHSTGEIK
jgi:uncharacterized protein YjiS (DUF1127 family)